MGGWLLQLLGGGLVEKFTGPLERAYAAKLNAANDAGKLEAEKQIAFYEGQIALARSAAEHDKWWSPRTLMAYAATAYVVKLILWDTVLQLGVTPDPGPQVNGLVMVIVGFYFGAKAVGDLGAKLLAAAVTRR